MTPVLTSSHSVGQGAATDFAAWLAAHAIQAERALEQSLPPADTPPSGLHEAMRYAVLGGGKRVRPMLVYAAGELAGAPQAALDAAAVAVELIHAYSLVHDDLPCMDDDVLRRGKPTVHVAFGEAVAMLVGDALQARAFEVLMAAGDAGVPAASVVAMTRTLAQAAGSRGMAGGQAIDLASVGVRLDRAQLEDMHRRKTGAMLNASVMLGALCGRVDEAGLATLARYAAAVGLAFQVVDDILDVEGDDATLGKTAGKDLQQDKPTYVSILGLAASKDLAAGLLDDALAALQPFGPAADRLRSIAAMIVSRSA
jgi:farnesyl diphosphate synthase